MGTRENLVDKLLCWKISGALEALIDVALLLKGITMDNPLPNPAPLCACCCSTRGAVDVGPLVDTFVVCCLAVVFLHVGSLFFYLLYFFISPFFFIST